jgi:hypothetical protein
VSDPFERFGSALDGLLRTVRKASGTGLDVETFEIENRGRKGFLAIEKNALRGMLGEDDAAVEAHYTQIFTALGGSSAKVKLTKAQNDLASYDPDALSARERERRNNPTGSPHHSGRQNRHPGTKRFASGIWKDQTPDQPHDAAKLFLS